MTFSRNPYRQKRPHKPFSFLRGKVIPNIEDAILRLIERGEFQEDIAKKWKLDRSTILAIWRRRRPGVPYPNRGGRRKKVA